MQRPLIAGAELALVLGLRVAPAAALAALLILAWVLGGATRSNLLMVAILEFVAIALVALVIALRPGRAPSAYGGRWPLLMLAVLVVVGALQLLPLPWQIWVALPGHAYAATGLELLGLDGQAKPLSIAPEYTASALLQFIPPVATFVIAARLPWRTLALTFRWTVLAVALVSTLWAIAQLVGVVGQLYPWTNAGAASGPFANANHHATLLLMCVPVLAASAGLARERSEDAGEGNEIALVWASVGFVVLLGVFLAGSSFGYLMVPFVSAISVLVSSTRLRGMGWRMVGSGFAASLVGLIVVVMTVGLNELGERDGAQSRSNIYDATTKAIVDFAPLGSGLGTFEKVFPLYESSDVVPRTRVNNAHNEYLQLVLELGVAGGLILAAFLVWLAWTIAIVWRRKQDYGSLLRMKMACSVAIMVPVLHSLLDYPLRSPAVACFAAACLAVLVMRREPEASQQGDDRVRNMPVEESDAT